MSEEQINGQLLRLQQQVADHIKSIKEVINDEDRWVAEEIAMKKQTSTQLIYPKYDKKNCYYQEFWKVYLINQIMISKIKEYSVTNKTLTIQLDELQKAEKEWSEKNAQKQKKKPRRTADEIDKTFRCPFQNCDKNYGSDVSLNLHMKLKHNSGTKTERQALARQVCLAQEQDQHFLRDICRSSGKAFKPREGNEDKR